MLEVLPYLFGAGGMFTGLRYWRQNRALKKNEVSVAEFGLWKQQVEWLKDEIKELRELLIIRNTENVQLQRDLELLNRKYSYKKLIIGCALECRNAESGVEKCPVQKKQAEVDAMFAEKS
jgi:hypothetical protein